MYRKCLKRFLDLSIALLLLVVLSPVIAIVAILLGVSHRGNPFFVQARPGKGGKIFHLIKFRTMNNRRDKTGELLPDHMRLTKTGALVRKTSLDELPQLLNVIRGQMSLIGPRPLLIEYLPLYSDEQFRRHEVLPGITGWAQVNGRNAISWEEKFTFDVYYVDRLSFGLDLRIVLLTIKKVFEGKGVNQQGQATAEKFTGNVQTNKTSQG